MFGFWSDIPQVTTVLTILLEIRKIIQYRFVKESERLDIIQRKTRLTHTFHWKTLGYYTITYRPTSLGIVCTWWYCYPLINPDSTIVD